MDNPSARSEAEMKLTTRVRRQRVPAGARGSRAAWRSHTLILLHTPKHLTTALKFCFHFSLLTSTAVLDTSKHSHGNFPQICACWLVTQVFDQVSAHHFCFPILHTCFHFYHRLLSLMQLNALLETFHRLRKLSCNTGVWSGICTLFLFSCLTH